MTENHIRMYTKYIHEQLKNAEREIANDLGIVVAK